MAVRPMGDVLGMATMLFSDEILPPERIDEIVEAGEGQDDQARAGHRQAAGRVARRGLRTRQVPRQLPRAGARADRAQGRRARQIAVQPAPEAVAEPAPDLMSALKASLDAVRAAGNGGEPQETGRRQDAGRQGPGQEAGRQEEPARRGHRQSGRCRPAASGSKRRRRRARRTPEALPLQTRLRASRPSPPDGGAEPARRARFVIQEHSATQPALGPAPGARRRARLLGDPQGPAGGAQGQPLCRGDRGSPARVPRLRGRDPEGPVRRRDR